MESPDGQKRYPVRKLARTGRGVVNRRADAFPTSKLTASDYAGAVYDVTSDQQTLLEDEVVAWVRAGRLAPTDLVQVDGQWVALADSMPFADVVAERVEADRRHLVVVSVVAVVVVVGFILFLVLKKP